MSTNSSFLSNIFMAAYIETQSLSKTVFKPTVWKCYIDDIFSLWDISKPDMVDFFKFTEQVNLLHPTAGFGLEYPTNKLLWGSISDFKKRLMDRGWPHNFERKIAIRSKTHRRKAALLKQNNKEEKEILPFVTQYKPLVSIIKEALMKKCNLIQNQPLPC